jgi:hypothetical protein
MLSLRKFKYIRTFYGRQHDSVNRYGISVSEITTFVAYHFPVHDGFFFNKSNTIDAIRGAIMLYLSGVHEFDMF